MAVNPTGGSSPAHQITSDEGEKKFSAGLKQASKKASRCGGILPALGQVINGQISDLQKTTSERVIVNTARVGDPRALNSFKIEELKFREDLQKSFKSNHKQALVVNGLKMGFLYYELGNKMKAKECLEEANKLLKSNNSIELEHEDTILLRKLTSMLKLSSSDDLHPL